jgi:hypothetical protein
MGRFNMSEHILSLSYGKDSLACLGAIEALGWPLDRIVHAEVWATDTIPADLPPMVEFKAVADKWIKDRYGIEVEHLRAKQTYEWQFYQHTKCNEKRQDESRDGINSPPKPRKRNRRRIWGERGIRKEKP